MKKQGGGNYLSQFDITNELMRSTRKYKERTTLIVENLQ